MIVSVIIPVKNRVDLISRAIQSVLNQTYKRIEIIVVDDCSTDGTKELVNTAFKNINLIINKESLGGAVSRNIGVDNSSGDLVAFLDSDDEWLPNHLERKVNFLTTSGIDGVFSSFYLVDESSKRKLIFDTNFPENFTIADKIASFKLFDARTSTFVFKKSKFNTIRFDENLKKHQDWDLAINFERKYNFYFDNEATVKIHLHNSENKMSVNQNHVATKYFLKKNSSAFYPLSLFYFCLKMVMRCHENKDKEAERFYLNKMESLKKELSVKEKIVLRMLDLNVINLNTIRKAVNYIKKITHK